MEPTWCWSVPAGVAEVRAVSVALGLARLASALGPPHNPKVFSSPQPLLPCPPLFKPATGPEQDIAPVSPPWSQLEYFDSESENLLQRHSPRRNVSVFELSSANRSSVPKMNVGIGKCAGSCRMPLERDDLPPARFLQGVVVRGNRHLPWTALPFVRPDNAA